MKYNVILAPSFIKTLRYTLNQYKYFSTTYATKIEKRVYESINFLSLFPFCAPSIKLKGKSSDYRKFIIKKRFLIIYQIINSDINLLYFIDGRQSPKNYFKNI